MRGRLTGATTEVELFEQEAADCAADGEFQQAARHWNGGIRLEVGGETLEIALDDGAVSAEQTVTITVTGTNDGPVAFDDTVGTTENAVLNSNVPAATDVDGTIASYALGGTTVTQGSLTFNPDGSYRMME